MAPSPGLHEMGKMTRSFISNTLARVAMFLADIPHFLFRLWQVDVQIATQFVVSHLAGVNFSSHAAAVWWLASRAGFPRTFTSIYIQLSNFFRHAGYLLAWPKVRWRLGRSDDKDEHILRLKKKIAFLEQRQTPCRSKKGALIAAIGASQSELIGALKYNSENLMHSHFDRMEQHLLQTMESMHSRHEARMGKILGEFAELNQKLAAMDLSSGVAHEPVPLVLPPIIPTIPPPISCVPSDAALYHLIGVGDQIQTSLVQLKFMALDKVARMTLGSNLRSLSKARSRTLSAIMRTTRAVRVCRNSLTNIPMLHQTKK